MNIVLGTTMAASLADLVGRTIELVGWMQPFGPGAKHARFALMDEPPCCGFCLPREAGRWVEVMAQSPISMAGRIRLTGVLTRVGEGAAARFQLHNARRVAEAMLSRRHMLAASALACVAVSPLAARAEPLDAAQARAALSDWVSVDIHTHAGRINGTRAVREMLPFHPVAAPMREGGMAAICLAAVSDAPTHRVDATNQIHPFRDPDPGELYAFAEKAFDRINTLVQTQRLRVITTAADLAAARAAQPSVIISAEGADFLEGRIERVAEAHRRWQLRHLQLTHYRVNELGDIQTEARVHNGLTDFGAAVIKECNRLGVVVDVAHGTFELVQRAARETTKPLVLSHTSLSRNPGPRSRTISADHARLIAGTGGVIGIWPPVSVYPDKARLAEGMARMVDVVGIDHVGLGSDMEGLVGASSFASYTELPDLAAALSQHGFTPAEIAKLLGGNYLRVFSASLA